MEELPPFLSSESMEGDPPCHWADFLMPQLRRCPYNIDDLSWQDYLGNGAEGCVSTIKLGTAHTLAPLALKVFFRTKPPAAFEADRFDHGWWSLENEARTVAVLEKASAGLSASQAPIHVPAQRKTRLDALASLYSCSLEGRQARLYNQVPPQERISLSDLFKSTYIRKCFGWVAFRGKDLMHLNRRIGFGDYRPEKGDLVPTHFEPGNEYFGIIYEFIPPATREAAAMQRQIDFFRYAGFSCIQPANEENWQGPGIKLDFGDFVTAVDPRFNGRTCFRDPTPASHILGHQDKSTKTGETDDHDKLMDAIDERQRQQRAARARARAVERAYCARYFAGDKEERHPNQVSTRLPEDALTAVRVPEIEPPVVRKAWRAYRKQKLEYLKASAAAKPPAEERGEGKAPDE